MPAPARLDVRLDDTDCSRRAEPARAEPAPEPRFEAAGRARADGPVRLRRRTPRRAHGGDLLAELRAVKGLIEERFGALAFMEKLQRRPAEARLAQKLLDCGFSPMLVRKMADGFDADAGDETAWAAQILERNLRTAAGRRGDRRPRRRVRADRPDRRRQDDDDGQDRRRLRRPPRRRQPRPDHARRLSRRRPRAAARLRPHPRRAGAHRARPRLARGPARAADRPRR